MSPLLLVLALTAVQRPADSAPPNVLFLFADDQRADTVAAYGNEHIVTPTLDALAARGFSFRSNYCMGATQGAVCVASRAMLMTGRSLYRSNDAMESHPTLPKTLRAAGYETFAVGKWHNGVESFLDSFDAGANLMFGGMSNHLDVPLRDLPRGGELTDVRRGEGMSSELFADAAIEYLASGRDEERPFFLYVAFTAPHDPRQPPQRWREHYDEHRPPLPANYMPQHPFHNGWMRGRDEQLAGWPRTKEVITDQLAEYYGMISHLDEQVGRVLAALAGEGLADETIVVYTADHGLALGSHGLLGKQSVYEHSMQCPLILAGPGVPHGESDALTYLLDLYPTLCDATGVAPPDGLDGVDLLPVVRGDKESVRDTLFTSFEDKMRGLRDARWKLIRYPRLHFTQLFDLEADPHELVNLAGEPEQAERVARMLCQLEEWQVRAEDPHPLTAEHADLLEYDPSDWTRKPDRWQPDWIREKYFDE